MPAVVDSLGRHGGRRALRARRGPARISTASSSETGRTRAPRCGSRTTSPSCSRRMSAVRTAPRDICERRADVRLDEAGVRRELTAHDGVAEGVVAGGGRHRRHILPYRCEDRQQSCFTSSNETWTLGAGSGARTRRGREPARRRPRRGRRRRARLRPRPARGGTAASGRRRPSQAPTSC